MPRLLCGWPQHCWVRALIEHLKVYPKHAELKLLFLEPVQIPIDFRQSKRATS
jgi:hypothetical protein